MNKADKTREMIEARMNKDKPQDAFDTGEDDELVAQLRSLKGAQGKQQTLALLSTNEIRVGAFVWKPTGLAIDGEITRADWEQVGKLLKQLDSSLQWLIGDLIVCGESRAWGDQKAIAEAFGFEYSTIRVYATVCRKIDLLIRINTLDFAHHQLVASMSPEEQSHWLQRAAEGDDGKRWSVARLRDEIENAEKVKAGKEPLPKYLKALYQMRKAYNSKNWKAMTKGERHRVYTELKGYLAYIGEEFEGEE